MQPPWKLVVEDLGRIAHAEVEARPLLLFVGGNNTGKTYLASLLWGLLTLTGGLPIARGEAFQRSVAWIEARFARREQESAFKIAPEVHADLVRIVNDTLQEQRNTLVERTFNKPGLEAGKIELRGVARGNLDSIRWQPGERDGRLSAILTTQDGFQYEIEAANAAFIVEILSRIHGPLASVRAASSGVSAGLLHPGAIFLPASRTGFMLLYRTLAQQLIGDALVKTGAPRQPVPDLTAPAIDFVKLLSGLRPEPGSFPEDAALLEQAMGGRLALRSDVGLPEVFYEHAEGEPLLPMQLSSSLVTELAPVVLTLRHVSGYRVLIIEEPEAHLHPHIQRALAQVIVRLVRKGLHVWITTHSENFCQQLNNFLKLGSLAPDRRAEAQQKLGYAEQDYLEVDDVGGYEFNVEGGRTVVKELTKTPRGLAMPTFNRELFALAREMDYLDDLAAAGEA